MPMGDRETAYIGKNVKVDFQLDVVGIAKIAMRNELKDAVMDIAEHRAMPYAIRISPRSNVRWKDHPHYQDQFKVVPGSTVINQMRRVAARLWNLSDHAIIVEFGNAATNGEGHRVFGRTLNYLNGPIVGELSSVRLDRQHAANVKRNAQRRANRAKGLAAKAAKGQIKPLSAEELAKMPTADRQAYERRLYQQASRKAGAPDNARRRKKGKP